MNGKFKKKIIIILITAIVITAVNLLFFTHLFSKSENSSSDIETVITANTESSTVPANPESAAPQANPTETHAAVTAASIPYFVPDSISAPYAGLYNLSTGEALYEKSAGTKVSPASLTKILTAVTALTYMDADTVLTVGTELELLPKRSSLCLIDKGHRLTLYDLLTGMLVASGNDAAYTIAVNVSRQVMDSNAVSNKEALSYFTDLMNATAQAIGCTDSNFTTPDGFDSEGQYTTIRDLMLICNYALDFKEIRELTCIVKKKVIFESGENVTWLNSNKLLHRESPYYYSQAVGIKTGTTPLSGMCLAAVAELKGQTYLVIICGCKSEDERYTSAINLFDFVSSM